MFNRFLPCLCLFLGFVECMAAGEFSWKEKPGSLQFFWDEKPVLEYVYRDNDIVRPFFTRLYSPNGIQLTRNHPPVAGLDAVDHPTMHPGAWLSFGDVSGRDYWRNKARTQHDSFVTKPVLKGGEVHFKVKNLYLSGLENTGGVVMEENAVYTIRRHPQAYSLSWECELKAPMQDIVFGDQEELGLGVRMNTPITVKKGGRITNADGGVNEKGTWGKTSHWADYSGMVGEKEAGVTLVTGKTNIRPSWFHTRDYGLMVANLFGKKAFTKQEPDLVRISKLQSLKFSYLLILHDGGTPKPLELKALLEQAGWGSK